MLVNFWRYSYKIHVLRRQAICFGPLVTPELILGSPAHRASPGIWKIFERNPGGNAGVRVPRRRVINIYLVGKLFHSLNPFKIKDWGKCNSSATLCQFLEVLLGGLKASEPVILLPRRGEQKGGGRADDLELPNQIHVGAPLQAHRDETLVQGLNHCGGFVGLTDQPGTVRSPLHIKFQSQRTVDLFCLLQRLLPVRAPWYQL
jgi:hypothetical protein